MRILSRIGIIPIVLLSPLFMFAQINEFEGDVKFSNLKENKAPTSVLVTDAEGNLSYKSLESFNIPNLVVDEGKLELIINGESYFIQLANDNLDKKFVQKFELVGSVLELKISDSKEVQKVDLSSLIRGAQKSATGGAFMTTSGVTSNMPGNVNTDDFVFGSTSLDDSGAVTNDSRFIFDKSKGAFRAGKVDGTQWDEANRGLRSFAIGTNSVASGTNSIAGGNMSTASGLDAVAFGSSNMASGSRSISIGNTNTSMGNGSVALGTQNMSNGTNSFAIGYSNVASSNMSIALGNNSTSSGTASLTTGSNTMATGSNSFAGGNGSMATNTASFAFGNFANSTGVNALAFSKNANASSKFGIAIGIGTIADSRAQVSLGSYNTALAGNLNDFITTDRLFVIGNGADDMNLSDALVMLKNGNTTLNGTLTIDEGGDGNSYTLPGADGTANQVMQTNGSGVVSWVNNTNTDNQNLSLGTVSGTMRPVNISGGTGVVIDVADNDNSATNELQNWSNLPGIPAGFSDNVDNVADADASATNELQTISAGGSTSPTINLSNSGGTITFTAGTNVTLSRSGNNITINAAGGGGGSSCSAFGDGSAGNKVVSSNENWSTSVPNNGNVNFDNLTINSGVTLTVPSGTIIRTQSNFVNNGTIVVLEGLPESKWSGHPDEGFGSRAGISRSQFRAHSNEELRHLTFLGPIGGSNGATGGNTGLTARGGSGGGTLTIRAGGTITNSGTINAIGGNASVEPSGSTISGSGGGGGGFILIVAEGTVSNTGSINVQGGNGGAPGDADDDHAGGGGGGGMVHFVCSNALSVGGTVNVSGGGAGAQPAGNLGSEGGKGGASAGDGGLGAADSSSNPFRNPEPGGNGVILRSQMASTCGFF